MKLFTPFHHPKIEFKNHLVMAPMCMYSAMNKDGVPTPFHHAHYGARAIGQVGYIIVEATGVNPEGRISDYCLGLWNDTQEEAFTKLVDEVHYLGSKIGLQLNHAGRKSTATWGVDTIYAPSSLPFDDASRTPLALSHDDIQSVFLDFKNAAKRADSAGFDTIEIHAAHGYLISQFISPITNKRTDKYKDPRVFISELLDHIESVWPTSRPLTMRVSATDYELGGYTVEDLADILLPFKDRIDILHVSSGGITPITPPRIFPGYQVNFASFLKNELGIPVIACGLLNQLDLVSEVLENDRVDLVAQGRNLLHNPNWLLDQAHLRKKQTLIPAQYIRAYK